MAERVLTGRKVIKVDKLDFNPNIFGSIIEEAYNTHIINRLDIEYLYNYYKGQQPILNRIKEVRPEINNKIVENRAYEIVTFKTGYLSAEPIQYVSRNGDEITSEQVSLLNEMMYSEHKSTLDKTLFEWNHICGTGYRLVLPDIKNEADESPFELFVLDPRSTFVIYSNQIGEKPLAGVTYWIDSDNVKHFNVYTKDRYIKLEDFKVVNNVSNGIGEIPIIEYPINNARLGVFEVALPLLDELNKIASNRMDGLEQEIQAFIKFINCEITLEDYEAFRAAGAIKVKSVDGSNAADVDVVKTDLNQNEAHIMSRGVYDSILTICGMPNRNGGSSTSDTGRAVEMRDGWNTAELRAKETEEMFKKSEQEMLKVVLKIANIKGKLNLKLKSIGMQFTRRNYENIQSKSQVLVSMLNNEKIHPLLAFSHSGLFTDPEKAYSMSMEYFEKNSREADQKRINEQNITNRKKVEGTTNKNAGAENEL